MKITIAQLNPVVGDVRGNLDKIINVLRENTSKSNLIIFSELFLVGYPPKDLIERKSFMNRVQEAVAELQQISRSYPETGILFGTPWPTYRSIGKGCANAALLLCNGEILLNQEKSLLPTYDVFDEARYFDPAEKIALIEFKGEKLGITICEDAWNEEGFWPNQRKAYKADPVDELVALGATMLINISASPFQAGKEAVRYDLIANQAKKHGLPFAFINQVGGNDELVFDGGSMIFAGTGAPLCLAPFFKEYIQTIDTEKAADSENIFERPCEIEMVHQALVLGMHDYLTKCGFSKAVIGLSGGIDSALVCFLAVEALGKENVLGITMPSPYSSAGSIADSQQLADNLGIQIKNIPISGIFESYLNCLTPYFDGKKPDATEENIQARIRGNIVMAFSNKFGYLALSTGNKSEMAVGYCTLYGDMSGGLSAISDVPKTMVYELCEHINSNGEKIPRNIIEKAPSAELRPDQKDQDTLPPYSILDKILQYYIEEGQSLEQIVAAGFAKETVEWVIRTVDRNEYKRGQAAPGLKITSKAFGIGRRMPLAKKTEVY